jgi:hypothetical protein
MPMLNKSKTLTGTVPVCLAHALRATTKSTDGKRDARAAHKKLVEAKSVEANQPCRLIPGRAWKDTLSLLRGAF